LQNIDFSKELDVLSKENRNSLKQLKQKAVKKAEAERNQESITNVLAAKEIEYLKRTVINLEVKQLAESCVRVCSRRLINKKRKGKFCIFTVFCVDYEYKVIFDESIRIPPLWIDEHTLHFLNQNREEVQKKTNTKIKNIKKAYPMYKMTKEDRDESYGFCHQCKQRKSSIGK
jgi:hypothetical protein